MKKRLLLIGGLVLSAGLLLCACSAPATQAPSQGVTVFPTVRILPVTAISTTRAPTPVPTLSPQGTRTVTDWLGDHGGSPLRVAFRQGGSASGSGELWTIKPDGSDRRRVTSAQNVHRVYGWSPDNRYIAVTLLEGGTGAQAGETIAVVDVGSGAITMLGGVPSQGPEVFWSAPGELAYALGDGVQVVSIADGSLQSVLPLPAELARAARRLLVSPDLTWVAFEVAGTFPQEGVNIFAHPLNSGETKPLSEDGTTYLGTWRLDKIVYHTYGQGNAVQEVNPDGSGRRRLIDLDNWFVVHMVASADGRVLFYAVEDWETCCGLVAGKLYVYDFSVGEARLVYTLTKETAAIDLAVSADGAWASFGLGGVVDSSFTIVDTRTGQVLQACEGACTHARWSH